MSEPEENISPHNPRELPADILAGLQELQEKVTKLEGRIADILEQKTP